MGNRLDPARIVTKFIPINAIADHPDNYNLHPDEQIAGLAESHKEFGQYRSILVWERPGGEYIRVVGHGYSQGATQAGETVLRAEVLPVDTPADVVKAIMLADNLHAQHSTFDETLLAQLLQEQVDADYDLTALGSDEETLRQMLENLGDELIGSGAGSQSEDEDFDTTPDEEQTRVRLGDIWVLGRHRIGCLNSCDPEQVRRLVGVEQITFVFADPPYGIDIVATNVSVGGGEAYDIPFGGVKMRKGDVGGTASHMRKTGKPYLAESHVRGTVGAPKPFGSKAVRGTDGSTNIVECGKYFPVIGDDSIETALVAYRLCVDFFSGALQVWWGANYYAHALPPSPCWIVWDKENTGNFADVELAWCSHKGAAKLFRHMWNGMLKASEHGQRRVHPTQKPVKLAEFCFDTFGTEQDSIYDPFLGSGISVIAAENASGDRRVIGCELSPHYIDVILRRWEDLTGQEARLLERVEEVIPNG